MTTATHHTIRRLPLLRVWVVVFLVCYLGLLGWAQQDDEHAAATAEQRTALVSLKAERQREHARQDACHKAHGPQAMPVEDADGNWRCMDARGRTAAMPRSKQPRTTNTDTVVAAQ